ncbi:MAG: hypothetical protein RL720_513 [Actinomycetota bacterium]|jgi:hypothetical protein
MPRIEITGSSLNVVMSFWEKVGSLSSDISVPLNSVVHATDDPTFIRHGLGFRTGGTGMPGFIAEGHFRKNGNRIFANWRRGEQVVVIELQGQKWDKLAIGCADAQATATAINTAIAGEINN